METKELITHEALPQVELNVEDVKKYICPGATDKELFLFMNIAKSYGLNPFKREIHFVKYGQNQGQTIVGYESFIKRAERTGKLDGWEVELGKDELGDKAIITIYRKDRKNPFKWTVYRTEFDSQQVNWKKMPLFMLRKVAISQGFRLAFPEELGGMPYIPEEINGNVTENLPRDDVTPSEQEALDPAREALALSAFEQIINDYRGITTQTGMKNHPKIEAELYRAIYGTEYESKAREAFKARMDEIRNAV